MIEVVELNKFLLCLMILTVCAGCSNQKDDIDNVSLKNPSEQSAYENENNENKENVENKESEVELKEDVSKEILISEDTSTLSNKTIGWYFMKGKDHAQPTFGKDLTVPADKYDAIYLKSADEKKIYLTFDEGYENGYTGQILDTLKEKNVKAVFFITGPYLEKEKELVKRMVDEGHEVGNHTVNHPSMPSCSDEELEKEVLDLDRKFYEEYGKSMKYLRPPMGEFSERTLSITKSLGYTNVFWSFAYRDWETDKQRGKDYAYNNVINALHPGEVMLLHAVSKDNADALSDIIDTARSMGYEFGEL